MQVPYSVDHPLATNVSGQLQSVAHTGKIFPSITSRTRPNAPEILHVRITVTPRSTALTVRLSATTVGSTCLALPVLCIGTQALSGYLFPFLVLGSLESIRMQP